MPKRNPGARLEWREERKVWEIIWYEQGKRHRRSTGSGDRAEADRQLAAHLTTATASRHPDRPSDPAERSIAAVLADYAREHGDAVASPQTMGYALKALLPYWAEKNVRHVHEGSCREYLAQRQQQGVQASTTARELSVLAAAIAHDWRAGRLAAVVPVWKPAGAEPRDRWLTREEAARLLRAARQNPQARGHLPLFILLALYTGARKEALLDLRWPQVDLERGLINLNPPGRERTKKGRPRIPISRRLETFLRGARRRGSDLGPVLHWRGHPIGNIKKAFAAAATRAGLEGVTPHTLRHTAATWMAQAGVPFPVIARFLGHASSATTERVYAHHAPDYLAPATAALDRRRVGR